MSLSVAADTRGEFGGRRATHALAREGYCWRKNQRVEACGKLVRARVPSKGRSGDVVTNGGVVGQS